LNLKRIAITGPESTGKSELAKQLAVHYQTLWVPEVARDYLIKLSRVYVFEDIAVIAKEQLEQENTLVKKAGSILFCDTDFLVTKIWSNFKYGKCDPWIEEKVKSHLYDLYLLCDIDLPWVEDPLREHPGQREELFKIYLKELQRLNVEFAIISGKGKLRLKNAILEVERTLSRGH
jgi:NadR type nicotinamide-nucleotide adenylyltransferase